MRPSAPSAGVLGAALGVLATGAAIGLAAERYVVGRARLRPDPEAAQPFFGLQPERTRTVRTEDGVDLHVEEVGPADADLTVVLVHGYVQEMAVWHYQRQALQAAGDVRVVLYDQRSHGRSTRGAAERSTIDQLGRDLGRVVDEVVPTGPVVLVGHSMGGMTVMALADARPELFGDRVVGVALVGTSAADLAAVTHGLPAPLARRVQRLLPALTELAVRAERRGLPRQVGWLDSRLLFPAGADPELVRQALDVHRASSAEVVAAFLPTLSEHDRRAALRSLAHVPAVVVVGDQDRLCPLAHSQALAAALPAGELTVFPGVGHMVHLERRAEVSAILLGLLDRALAPAG